MKTIEKAKDCKGEPLREYWGLVNGQVLFGFRSLEEAEEWLNQSREVDLLEEILSEIKRFTRVQTIPPKIVTVDKSGDLSVYHTCGDLCSRDVHFAENSHTRVEGENN